MKSIDDMEHNPMTFPMWDCVLNTGKYLHDRGMGALVTLYGRSGSGKSTFMEYFLYMNHTKFRVGMAMSCVSETIDDYSKHMPPSFVLDHHNDEVIERLFGVFQGLSRDKTWPMDPWLVVVDDSSDGNDELRKSKIINTFARRGRHLQGFMILVSQEFMAFSKTIRKNTHLMIIGGEPTEKGRTEIYKNFLGSIIPDRDEFELTMDMCTSNYGFLVLDMTPKLVNLPQQLCRARADPKRLQPFRIGNKYLWAMDYVYRTREATIRPSQLLQMPGTGRGAGSGIDGMSGGFSDNASVVNGCGHGDVDEEGRLIVCVGCAHKKQEQERRMRSQTRPGRRRPKPRRMPSSTLATVAEDEGGGDQVEQGRDDGVWLNMELTQM